MNENFNLSGVRRRKIAELVAKRGSLAVGDLCAQFGMSEATIRRDLRVLDQLGVVKRTRGGVMMNAGVMFDLPNEERKQVGAAEKSRIGLMAVNTLEGNEVVFLDAGTTALAVADNAYKKPDCRYVTTCLGVARRLRSQDIRSFYVVGGSYQPVNDSFVGSLAISALRSLSFDVSFLCCSSIDIARRAIALGDEAYSLIQREAIAVTRRNIVVAHYKKFDANAFIRTASFDELDGVITDSGVDRDSLTHLQGTGLEVILA